MHDIDDLFTLQVDVITHELAGASVVTGTNGVKYRRVFSDRFQHIAWKLRDIMSVGKGDHPRCGQLIL
jgi:hypothetical protein